MPVKPCEVCGGPVRSETGVCRKTQECKREFWRRTQAAGRGGLLPTRPCAVCSHPTWSKYGVCNQTEACRREAGRLSARALLLTPGRRCRDFGQCGALANLRSYYCTEHASAANKRHKKTRRSAEVQFLGSRQEWICPWCDLELPDDLTDIEVDHIIPKASGLVIEEDWNLQLLHGRCNVEKFSRITDDAIRLATEHGFQLSAS
jgi:5-methylcytosine-specific restriction endonuclease McrA